MKRMIVSLTACAAAVVGALAVPATSAVAVEGDTLLRASCTTWSDANHKFDACISLVRDKNGKLVAKGSAIGDKGDAYLQVRVTNLRLQSRLCGVQEWKTVRHRPSKDGWHAADFERTRPWSRSPGRHLYRARGTVSWKFPDGNDKHTQRLTTRPKGSCP
jgi:hypothetical protein